MAVIWEKYHIGIDGRGNKLFIGRGDKTKSGILKWLSKSPDRTQEIIEKVAMKMRLDLNEREDGRPWVGYDIPGAGKLILVKPGYDYEVKKHN